MTVTFHVTMTNDDVSLLYNVPSSEHQKYPWLN